MAKPRKLTIAAAADIARNHDPAAWDAMSPAERRALVDQVNDHHAKAWAADDHLRKMFPKAMK